MIGLAIRFDLGRYHATPWGSNVNDASVEWPPSPWRVLRALYAVSRSNLRAAEHGAAIDDALARLVVAGPPSYRLPASAPHHTRHYLPSRAYRSGSHGKDTDKVLDGFLAIDRDAELTVWWDADLKDEELAGLEAAAAALGYLGRSESVCSAHVVVARTADEIHARPITEDAPADDPVVSLLCPTTDDPLSAVTISVTELRKRRLLEPPGSEWLDYAVRLPAPAAARPKPSERPTLARFRVHGGSRPSMHDAVAVTSHLRSALQGRYGRENDNAVSSVFSGRSDGAPRTDQHRHAHYLATPGSDGRRIDHVVVWAPEGFGSKEIAALAGLTELRMRETAPLRLALTAIGMTDEMRLESLLGPAHAWRSLTPFALNRHSKRRGGRVVDGPLDQIRRELVARGFPEPESIELIRGPWLEYRRVRSGRSRLEAPRVVGARIAFPEPVRGPIALGALSHFGLGLFTVQP